MTINDTILISFLVFFLDTWHPLDLVHNNFFLCQINEYTFEKVQTRPLARQF